jgi:hypothetical protein
MRAIVDSIASVVRPLTFSFARSSSSTGIASSCTRWSSVPITSSASAARSGRVPT